VTQAIFLNASANWLHGGRHHVDDGMGIFSSEEEELKLKPEFKILQNQGKDTSSL